jgi:phosphoribosylamine--glycine ligase
MGAYAPAPVMTPELLKRVNDEVLVPTVMGMKNEGIPFKGILYAGLMLTDDGVKVLEYNVRFGDPETQAVLPRLRTDLRDVLEAATRPGGLADVSLKWAPEWAVTLVLASAGYPASASKGDVIEGLDEVPADVEITHAGTARGDDGTWVTNGGRVLNVTTLGATVDAARNAAYAAADMITFAGRQLRRDIARRAVERVA